ncbi:MAG TPA: hypothetical protein P5149_15465 [Candidatus Competibacteraceae bacterium]|nr:hypothetical protein [Candidatus Competibacteraceae bacterium]HRY19785.1 hypothetical protein [Candidatus Competibacteraceae bacterium]
MQSICARVDRSRNSSLSWAVNSRQELVVSGGMICATGASRNTLKGYFRGLLQQGYRVRHGAGKTAWDALP